MAHFHIVFVLLTVSHKQEKPVVNCVLELARIGWKYGIEPPNLIRMEREIEKESKEFEPPPFIPKPVEIVKQKPVEKPVEKKPEKPDLHKEVSTYRCKAKLSKNSGSIRNYFDGWELSICQAYSFLKFPLYAYACEVLILLSTQFFW